MFIRYFFKKKLYKKSSRNFLNDYSKIESKKIDMTLSGRYLYNYPELNISIVEFDKYPLSNNIIQLENLIKSKINVQGEIIIGPGVNGLLQNIIKILFNKKGNLVTPFYTFDQAEYAVTSYGGKTKRVYTKDYNVNIDDIIKSIDKKTKMIYICNPNNPTGKFIESNKLLDLCKKTKIPIVVDESGIEFTKEKSILEITKHMPNNLIVLRSFSKAYGLANLRIGYLVCNKTFKKVYMENITTNECTGISYIIAKKILENSNNYMENNVNKILIEKEIILKELRKMGIEAIKGSSNTVFTKTYFNKEFINELNKNNISVVPIYDINNNLHLRIAVQDEITNDLFIKKLKQVLKNEQFILGVFEDK